MKAKQRDAVVITVLALMLLGLPPVGVYVAGLPLARYFEFPPRTLYVIPAAFSIYVFVVYLVFITGCCLPLLRQVAKTRKMRSSVDRSPIGELLPWWGWSAAGLGIGFWCLAWTRFDWFAAWQPHTFVPLWVCYVLTVNAIDYSRTGWSLLTHQTGFFLMLFPVSAVFWWFFEYLNRFVQNWRYEGVEYPPLVYLGLATVSFATVLPAVMSTRRLVIQSRWLQRSFTEYRPFRISYPRLAAWSALVLSACGLLGVGVWTDWLFALLWVAPVLAIAALQTLVGRPGLFSGIARGDWRPVVASAVAALICGFFWEMWNYYSLSRWVYRIPFVDSFRLFEMPVLGYAGYLPFGLTCAAVSDLLTAKGDFSR